MHKEILTPEQAKLLPLLKSFSDKFGLVGGTAIALYIGHRESIDYDLLSLKPFNNTEIINKISENNTITNTLVNQAGEFTSIIDGVKFTFFHFPFIIPFNESFENVIRLPDLLTLTAMKAFALGQRAKWKDYVDMYFILEKYYKLEEIMAHTSKLFDAKFNQKIFRAQLCYFDDIDYSEEVIFRPGFETDQKLIKEKLTQWSLS